MARDLERRGPAHRLHQSDTEEDRRQRRGERPADDHANRPTRKPVSLGRLDYVRYRLQSAAVLPIEPPQQQAVADHERDRQPAGEHAMQREQPRNRRDQRDG
jgi:hypothetical protein